jgi:hypothetical protein
MAETGPCIQNLSDETPKHKWENSIKTDFEMYRI